MEDVRVLFEILDSHGVYDVTHDAASRDKARNAAFETYTKTRVVDVHAINDLSKGNFIEMRAGVNSRWYKLRKFIEENLDRYMPQLGWRTQYSRVSFSNMRYSEIMRAVERQRLLLTASLGMAVFTALVSGLAVGSTMIWRHPQRFGLRSVLGYVAGRR